jgi:hypothetical protein
MYLGEFMEAVTETEIFAPDLKEITTAIMNIKLKNSRCCLCFPAPQICISRIACGKVW